MQAQVVRQLTDEKTGSNGAPTLDDGGTTVWANMSTDQFGTNPLYVWQIAAWDAATGAGSQRTGFPQGVAWSYASAVSVSDDGQTVAFISPADPLGTNHDESLELFTMNPDGTAIVQLTDDAAPNAGSVLIVALAGFGNRVAFVANTDPLGSNPGHLEQLFVIDSDGTGLRQLTSAPAGAFYGFSISDDGERIVFANDGEIYAVNADGTGLRQLTSSGQSSFPAISGNGARIVFQSYADLVGSNPAGSSQIFVVDWDGTGLDQLTPGESSAFDASITDDAEFVVYADSFADAAENPDGNVEIWKVRRDGSGRTALTRTADPIRNSGPVVSGSGNRIAFHAYGGEYPGGSNPDGGRELMAMDGDGGGLVQLTANHGAGGPPAPDLTPDGSRIVFKRWDVYRIQADGSDLLRVTDLVEAPAQSPGVSGDGNTIVFDSHADPLGQNPGAYDQQIFSVQADGTGLRQLTTTPVWGCGLSIHPVIAADGSYVVFQSCNDLVAGQNLDLSAELFRVRPDGTGLLQITDDDDGTYKLPRVDENGIWVVFQSATNVDGGNPNGRFQILRVKTDGTGVERITSDPDYSSTHPDVSGSGDRIVYTSSADPLGTNPDHNGEVFLYEVSGGTLRQLTSTSEGDSYEPRISKDGAFVYFKSDAPVFEAQANGVYDAYRVEVATGIIERVGALRRGLSDLWYASFKWRDYHIAPDGTGRRAVFGGFGDWVDRNPDFDYEVYLVDHSAAARIRVAKASPTALSWDPEPRPLRYDVIRGDVANLGPGPGDSVDLGPVLCLEDDSPDADTVGFEDPEDPAPGQLFFYAYRGSQGLDDGPGSWGQGSGGKERIAGFGNCLP